MTTKTLRLTPAIAEQLGRVERAASLYPNEDESVVPLLREKLGLRTWCSPPSCGSGRCRRRRRQRACSRCRGATCGGRRKWLARSR
jgi:hypothetical protein